MIGLFDRIRQVLGREQPPRTDVEAIQQADQWTYPTILVPETVCEETCNGLRSHSPTYEDHEGVVYWAGMELGEPTPERVLVTSCIVPEASTGPGHFEVSALANMRVTEAVHEHDIGVLATVHSHPGTSTIHSGTDEGEAFFPYDGSYSIVVPEYAHEGMLPLTSCGIYRYETDQFRRLDTTEINEGFTVLSAPSYIDTRP